MRDKKIDAFLIGAQKAGSTTLYSWLSNHPEVDAPDFLKDFHFFTSPKYYEKGTMWLESHYGPGKNKKRLHGAVNYIFRKDAAELINEYNSDAKLILVLRDPVKRSFSAYQFFRKLGREDRSFEEAIKDEKLGKFNSKEEEDDFAYIKHGFYYAQIHEWLKYFKKEQLYIIIYEEFFRNPQSQLKELFKFMGLKDQEIEIKLESKNVSGAIKYKFLNQIVYGENSIIRRFLNFTRLKNLIPIRYRGSFLNNFRDWNTKEGSKSEVISEVLYRELIKEYENDIDRLSDFLDKDLTKIWKI